jgi:hypothetical protein
VNRLLCVAVVGWDAPELELSVDQHLLVVEHLWECLLTCYYCRCTKTVHTGYRWKWMTGFCRMTVVVCAQLSIGFCILQRRNPSLCILCDPQGILKLPRHLLASYVHCIFSVRFGHCAPMAPGVALLFHHTAPAESHAPLLVWLPSPPPLSRSDAREHVAHQPC